MHTYGCPCVNACQCLSMPLSLSLPLSLPPSLPSNLSIYLKSPASTDSATQPSPVSAPSRVFFASFLSGSQTFHFSRPSDLKPHVCPPKPRHSPHSCTKLQPLIVSFCIPIYVCCAEWKMTAKSLLALIHVNLKLRLHNVPFLSLQTFEPRHASTPLLSRHHVCLGDAVSSHFQLRPMWRIASTESNAWTYAYPMYVAQGWWHLWTTAHSPGTLLPSWAPQPTTPRSPRLDHISPQNDFLKLLVGVRFNSLPQPL